MTTLCIRYVRGNHYPTCSHSCGQAIWPAGFPEMGTFFDTDIIDNADISQEINLISRDLNDVGAGVLWSFGCEFTRRIEAAHRDRLLDSRRGVA